MLTQFGKINVFGIAMLLFFLVLTGTALAGPPDVEGHWAENRISMWLEEGWIAGYEDGYFRPDDPVTRAEFVAFVNRAFGFAEKKEHAFTDVPEDVWYAPHVERAAAAGYISGYEDQTFRPEKNIARQEAASILYSLLDLPDPENDPLEEFEDAGEVPGWSRARINAVLGEELMSGYPDGTFQPAGEMTRAETVATLSAALEMAEEITQYYPLTLVVQDGEGTPLEGAIVLLNDVEHTADEEGRVALEAEPGRYDYKVEKKGYVTQKGAVEVVNKEVTKDVVMEEPAAVLRLDEDAYAPGETVQLTVENVGTTDVQLGYPFAVEKLVEEEWTQVELDIAWIMVLVSLKPGETLEQELTPAEDFKEEVQPGEYRVTKEVECLDTGKTLKLQEEFELLEQL